MYFHLAAYGESIDNTANSDMNAVADEILTIRNNHLIFTEPFDLIAALPAGAQLTRARFGNAALSQKGRNHLWPINQAATVNSPPSPLDFRDFPMKLPQNEELTIEVTNAVAGPTDTYCLLWLAKPEWSENIPSYADRLKTRATAVVVAGSETTWTALADLTFEQDLLNGVYAVIGANVVAANALAFRMRFPSQPVVGNKQLRPGGLVQTTIASMPWKAQVGGFGEWGRFHTFEPPQIQVFADAAGGTYEVRLDLLYLGTDDSLLFR